VLNPALKPPIVATIMRILSVITILATVGLTSLNNESQAQTVRDDSGETYFLSSVRSLCGPRAQVYLAPHSAKVVLSGEYLEDRNLDSARAARSPWSSFMNSHRTRLALA
jgi:hypothetical protein